MTFKIGNKEITIQLRLLVLGGAGLCLLFMLCLPKLILALGCLGLGLWVFSMRKGTA